jgi:prolyl-tRNA editing enzyme YbaK/EbsC (Cys-tRNA(Pro) deacylase)
VTTSPALAPVHLLDFLSEHGVEARFHSPGVPMPTVVSAAAAIGVSEEQILKTLLFVGDKGDYAVAIANGTRRIDRSRFAAASGLHRPRAARPDEVLAIMGFPAGGVAPLALPSTLLVVADAAVAALPLAYGGGGHEELLLEVKPKDVVRLNRAVVATIVEER